MIDAHLPTSLRALWVAVILAAGLLLAPGAALAQPGLAPPQILDGPNANIVSLGGMSVARDGTGGVVYTKSVGGVAHVFVSPLIGGIFRTPEMVDGGLSGASSTPVIAAGTGGELVVAFINGGELYVSRTPNVAGSFSTPTGLAAQATSPSLSMDGAGLAYLTFAVAAGSGQNVVVDYFDGNQWTPATGPMNATPGDDAGSGDGAPDVATAGDGVGIVTWGENGHVYVRRVWATAPSTVTQQLDPPTWAGSTEVSAGSPELSVGGDSSYVDVAYREQLQAGGQTQATVLLTRLIAEQVGSTTAIGGLVSTQTTLSPQLAMNEYGRGYATAGSASNDVQGVELGTNGGPNESLQVNSDPNSAPPLATPGLAGLVSTFVAWQHSPLLGLPEIDLRFAQDGNTLGTTTVISSPSAGPTQAALGLQTGGDNVGDGILAWVQGLPGALSIVTAQLYQPPRQPLPAARLAYARATQPVLAWSPSVADWGPITYTVTLDGAPIGQTTGLSLSVPSPLIDGPHVWSVTASNPGGETSTSPAATVFVDTSPPLATIQLSGKLQIGDRLRVRVLAADPSHAGQPGARASGVASVSLKWGDGTPVVTGRRSLGASHVYTRARTFTITARVTDVAGNATQVTRTVRIARRPVKRKVKGHGKGKRSTKHQVRAHA